MIWGIVGLLAIGFVADLWYMYILVNANLERTITVEDDDMDYVELNDELIPYNEEDQE